LSAQKKSIQTATLASVVPGMGHIYMGEIRKGLGVLVVEILVIIPMLFVGGVAFEILVALFALIWIYNVYDARSIARIIIEGTS
jgi:hypothetical protein